MSYSCTESWIKDELYGTSPIPTKLLNYVWTQWDHPVEVNPMLFSHCVFVAHKQWNPNLYLLNLITGSTLSN